MAMRWTYPQPTDRLPTVTVRKVPFGQLDDHFPASTPRVSPDDRREQVRVRQEHVQRRYRQY